MSGDIYKFSTDLLWLSHFHKKGMARYPFKRNGDDIKVGWINQNKTNWEYVYPPPSPGHKHKTLQVYRLSVIAFTENPQAYISTRAFQLNAIGEEKTYIPAPL